MIAYVDASVLLRVALGQPNALREWQQIRRGISSALVVVESLRTIDRLRARAHLSDAEIARRRSSVHELIDSLEIVGINDRVLERAAQPMPTELGTLDTIHLATALLWNEMSGIVATMATHDVALGIAAQAHGLPVVGMS
jgi:predicted nucleic acid-binding protein